MSEDSHKDQTPTKSNAPPFQRIIVPEDWDHPHREPSASTKHLICTPTPQHSNYAEPNYSIGTGC